MGAEPAGDPAARSMKSKGAVRTRQWPTIGLLPATLGNSASVCATNDGCSISANSPSASARTDDRRRGRDCVPAPGGRADEHGTGDEGDGWKEVVAGQSQRYLDRGRQKRHPVSQPESGEHLTSRRHPRGGRGEPEAVVYRVSQSSRSPWVGRRLRDVPPSEGP